MGAVLRTLPTPSELGEIPLYAGESRDVVVACAGEGFNSPFAVALTPSEAYPAALIARDLATLSHVAPVVALVLDGELARDAKELITALWTGDEVTLANAAGRLERAYCRPVPARELQVLA